MTGSVTLENIRLSLVAGTAFADFSEAGVLTNALGGKLTVTDSGGVNKAVGYIKAAGSGETLSDERITNGALIRKADWTVTGEDGTHILTDVPTGLHFQSDTLTPALTISQALTGASLGTLWKVTASLPTVTSGAIKTSALSNLVLNDGSTTYRVWISASATFAITRNSADVDLIIGSLSAKQVLTPSATGVTIVSTVDGTTQSWESVDANFNYNDSNGYTYSIDFSRGWGVKRPRGIRRWTDEYGNERVMYY